MRVEVYVIVMAELQVTQLLVIEQPFHEVEERYVLDQQHAVQGEEGIILEGLLDQIGRIREEVLRHVQE